MKKRRWLIIAVILIAGGILLCASGLFLYGNSLAASHLKAVRCLSPEHLGDPSCSHPVEVDGTLFYAGIGLFLAGSVTAVVGIVVLLWTLIARRFAKRPAPDG